MQTSSSKWIDFLDIFFSEWNPSFLCGKKNIFVSFIYSFNWCLIIATNLIKSEAEKKLLMQWKDKDNKIKFFFLMNQTKICTFFQLWTLKKKDFSPYNPKSVGKY